MDLSPPEIPVLLEQAKEGNQEAFESLWLSFAPRLLRQATLLCGDVSRAEDIVQETLVESWKSLSRYNGSCQFFTWLCAILHNRYRNAFRRRQFLVFWGLAQAEGFDESGIVADHPGHDGSPVELVQTRERAVLIRRCVQALPSKQQQVIYLRFFVDDSLEGIAAALHCSVGTVKSRLFHGLEKLRRMPPVQKEHEDNESVV